MNSNTFHSTTVRCMFDCKLKVRTGVDAPTVPPKTKPISIGLTPINKVSYRYPYNPLNIIGVASAAFLGLTWRLRDTDTPHATTCAKLCHLARMLSGEWDAADIVQALALPAAAGAVSYP